ncbi:RNA-binding domain-containing protein [Azospirillum argentinense]
MGAKGQSKLSRQEVALIKAMLAKDFPRQDILAYFSRPGRSVNMFRIKEIRSGEKFGDVPTASDHALQAFIDSYEKAILQGVKIMPAGPLDAETLAVLFRLTTGEQPNLIAGENEQLEFKEAFNWASPEHYAKAMAAFANTKGGYLVFGIDDKGGIIGQKRESFEKHDNGKITQFLNKHFSPAIEWDRVMHEVAGKTVGVIYTHPAKVRPVVCVADKQGVLNDGEIYYRYGGRNDRIRSGELRHILEQRERDVGEVWLHKFARMAEIGVQNVGLLDSQSGEVEGPGGSFLIDKDLLERVKFIREGQFTEKAGAPTLKLVGDVQAVEGDLLQPTVTVKLPTAISEPDMLAAFLDQKPVRGAKEFIRSIVHRGSWWVPVYFFIGQACISVEEAVKLLQDERGGNAGTRDKLIERLRLAKDCSVQPNSVIARVRERVLKKEPLDIKKRDEAGHFLAAVQTLKPTEVDLDYLLPLIRDCIDKHYFGTNTQLKGHIRKAVSHLDFALFAATVPASREVEEAGV